MQSYEDRSSVQIYRHLQMLPRVAKNLDQRCNFICTQQDAIPALEDFTTDAFHIMRRAWKHVMNFRALFRMKIGRKVQKDYDISNGYINKLGHP